MTRKKFFPLAECGGAVHCAVESRVEIGVACVHIQSCNEVSLKILTLSGQDRFLLSYNVRFIALHSRL